MSKNELNLILKVWRPDFLGESKWEFRFDKRNMTAIMADLD